MIAIVWGLCLFAIVAGLIMVIAPEKATSKSKRNDPNQVMTTRIIGIVLIVINIKFIIENI